MNLDLFSSWILCLGSNDPSFLSSHWAISILLCIVVIAMLTLLSMTITNVAFSKSTFAASNVSQASWPFFNIDWINVSPISLTLVLRCVSVVSHWVFVKSKQLHHQLPCSRILPSFVAGSHLATTCPRIKAFRINPNY